MRAVESREFEEWTGAARLNRVAELVEAIRACHPEDLEQVLSVYLEELRTDGPRPALMDLQSDADFWASLASFDQLRAFYIACGRRLVQYPLGRKGRMRLATRMLTGMPVEERASALAELAAQLETADAG